MARSWWGWGNVGDAVTGKELEALLARVSQVLPDADLTTHQPPDPASIEIAEPRIRPPQLLADITSADHTDRLAHSHGQAFRDVVRMLHGQVDDVPDLVVRPGRKGTSSSFWSGARTTTSPRFPSAAVPR